ncbi:MAG TPA: YibE/F family protein [Propionibacteriaceae bacterium]|nr:YibE/F family protein [Propionibacteriaceae bacterium]
MSHSHSHTGPTSEQEAKRHRKALRIMVVVLIPLAVWTVAGLIAFWPGDVSSHIRKDLSLYSVPGVTYPTAKITTVTQTSCEGLAGSTPGVDDQTCATVAAQLTEGPEKGQTVEVPLNNAIFSSGTKVGQDIKLLRLPVEGQPANYQFADFERRTPLVALTLLFAVAVVAVARWRGLASLLGLGFAGFILVKFMFPALVAGSNPVLIGLLGSAAIMFVVLYAAHGFSARTTTALMGTLFGLILSAALGWGATKWAHLTGAASEDDLVLSATAPDLALTSVVICGIIVAGLGVLNDVTITQASAVWELADSDPDQKKLFSRAMRIGRDHIASTVYTIAFATAGAVLPVLLLIVIYDRPLFEVIQTEMFAGEVVRTVVGSIGLVLAVPLTTAIGVAVVRASRGKAGEPALAHSGSPHAGPGDGPGAGPTSAAAERERRLRRKRRDDFDDFDDFSDLRDPDDRTTSRKDRLGQ